MTSFCYLFKIKNKKERSRFISFKDKTTSFHNAACLKTISSLFVVPFCRGGGGGGGGGERKRGPPVGGPLVASEISLDVGGSGGGPVTVFLDRQAGGGTVDGGRRRATATTEGWLSS